jgi:hypothetical protein
MDHQVRRIYTDGRKHLEGAPLTFMGDSIGKWDGDTLVVETVGLNDLTWLDGLGHPHSDALRIVERIKRFDHDTLVIDFLFDDPKAYTKPWTGRKIYKSRPNWQIMEYILCEDHMKEEFSRKMGGETKGP